MKQKLCNPCCPSRSDRRLYWIEEDEDRTRRDDIKDIRQRKMGVGWVRDRRMSEGVGDGGDRLV